MQQNFLNVMLNLVQTWAFCNVWFGEIASEQSEIITVFRVEAQIAMGKERGVVRGILNFHSFTENDLNLKFDNWSLFVHLKFINLCAIVISMMLI